MTRKGSARAFCAIGLLCVCGSAVSSETQTYTYDAMGRLIAVTRVGAATAPTMITYDDAGNRKTMSVGGAPPGVVANASFESPSAASATDGYLAGSAANLSGTGTTFQPRSGIARDGSTIAFPAAPDGTQVAWVQARNDGSIGSFEQAVSGLQIGTAYKVVFTSAVQQGRSSNTIQLHVRLTSGGSYNASGTFAPAAANTQFTSPTFIASATSATLRFSSTSGTVNTAWSVDQVSVVPQ